MINNIIMQIINKNILSAVYQLVCRHFNDPVYQKRGELPFESADEWIDCWVGCASVVVQNRQRVCGIQNFVQENSLLTLSQEWGHYLQYGPESWEKIIEPDGKRRVGLRFMYMVLKLDPSAYIVCLFVSCTD